MSSILDNHSQYNRFQSLHGVHINNKSAASSFIKQSQLKRTLEKAFPTYNSIKEYLELLGYTEVQKTANRYFVFISKIVDLNDSKLDYFCDLLDEKGFDEFLKVVVTAPKSKKQGTTPAIEKHC